MLIGIDFDNTIVSYDEIFYSVAREKGLVPASVDRSKQAVRDYLRQQNQEESWTEMQGYVYGDRMTEAAPFPGVRIFFLFCRKLKIPVRIISHKTRHPYRGPRYDLHRAALEWLDLNDFFNDHFIGLRQEDIFFEPTKEDKLARIAAQGCSHFIDDLPEFLNEPNFPTGVMRILFDSNGGHQDMGCCRRLTSWQEIKDFFNGLIQHESE